MSKKYVREARGGFQKIYQRPDTIFKKYVREARGCFQKRYTREASDDFQKKEKTREARYDFQKQINQRGQIRFSKNTPERPDTIFNK